MQEKRKNFKTSLLMLSVMLAFLLFVMLAVFVRKYDNLPVDSWVYENLVFRSNFFTAIFKVLTYIGSFWGLLAVSLIVLAVFNQKEIGISCLAGLLFSGAVNFFLKLLFSRDRPAGINLINEAGYSFPSGHAMMSIAVFGVLIFFAFKYCTGRKVKIVLTILLVFLTIFVGYTRIYLGVHYFSDIIAGWCLGYVLVVLIILVKNRIAKRRSEKEKTDF